MMSAFVQDCLRYSGGARTSLLSRLRLVLRHAGLQALFVYRLCMACKQSQWAPIRACSLLLQKTLGELVAKAYDIRLDLSAEIGPGLYIGHLGNIRLERCVVGANCSIGQSSQIIGPESGDRPQIGDRVWFGAHARLDGQFKVGSGATVSAGALVCRDLPPGALCLGVPVRVVLMGYDNSAFLGLPPAAVVATN